MATVVRTPNPSHCTMRARGYELSPGSLSALKDEYNKEMENQETGKVFFGRKTVCVDRHGQAQKEKHVLWGGLNHLYGAVFPNFLFSSLLSFFGSESIFVLTQGPPLCVHIF